MRRSILRLNVALASSLLLLLLGLLLLLTHSKLIEHITRSNLQLLPDSHLFGIWRRNPVPLTIDFYFFNWTNPHEVYDLTKKPRFVQLGPYRFDETKEKVNVTFNANDTVTFRHLKYWYFNPEMSNGDLSDLVNTINPVLLVSVLIKCTRSSFVWVHRYLPQTAATQMKDYNTILRLAFSRFSAYQTEDQIHVTKTIGELLFDGYDDPFITMGNVMPIINTIPGYDKFGWFYKVSKLL